jgi:O-acetyl-ADP-ribose deacetylase (regulator of RNase III)
MIREVQGDILLSHAAGIAHGVAPGDHFDSGLALQLREQWPALVRDFRHHCHTASPRPGGVWSWAGANGLRIFNLLTQEPPPGNHGHAKPGHAKLEYVNHALRALRKVVEDEKLSSLALPRIATGVGGLDWITVKPLVQQYLGDLAIPVYVYSEYKKGVAATES